MTTRLDRLPIHPASAPSAEGWELRVEGLVTTSLALSLEALAARPFVELHADFLCEEGWEVSGLRWEGVPLDALLAEAAPAPAARFVGVGSGDFVSVIPLEDIAPMGAILALRLDGEPLPPENGGPLRLAFAAGACYQSVKWVDRLIVTETADGETARETARARLAQNREER